MHIYDISQEILSSSVYPGDPAPEVKKLSAIPDGDVCNLSAISMCLHNGTHIDAPCHFVDGGDSIDKLAPEIFIGECTVVCILEKMITGADIDECVPDNTERVIIKTGIPGALTCSAASALIDKGVRLVGIDSQSVAVSGEEAAVHLILQQNDIVIMEGLALNSVPSGDYLIVALPLKIAGADGAPCRAVLLQD